jgi:hypothetical protein
MHCVDIGFAGVVCWASFAALLSVRPQCAAQRRGCGVSVTRGSESRIVLSGEQSQGFAEGSEEHKRDDMEDLQHARPAPAI